MLGFCPVSSQPISGLNAGLGFAQFDGLQYATFDAELNVEFDFETIFVNRTFAAGINPLPCATCISPALDFSVVTG